MQKLAYGYDAANNVLSIADNVTPANSQTFLYDPLNRLKSAVGAYGNQAWAYDPVGNRLTQTASGVTTTYGYATGSNRIASVMAGSTTQTVGTTAVGNINSFSPAFGTVTNLTYNQANRLATTTSGTTQLTQYTYDAFGQRAVKLGSTTATTLFQYDQGGHLLEQTDGTGAAQVDYVYLADRPIATFQPSNGKMYFLHDDRLGTPQSATDSTQAVAWNANYQPFGYTSTGIGVIVENLRFPGQEFEVETWWNHNGFRDYAPILGRYLESDPIGLAGGTNTYRYASNSPVTATDQRGLKSQSNDYQQTLQVLTSIVNVNQAINTFLEKDGGLVLGIAAIVVGGVSTFGVSFGVDAAVVALADDAGGLIAKANMTQALWDPKSDAWSIGLAGLPQYEGYLAALSWGLGTGDTLRTSLGIQDRLRASIRGAECSVGASQTWSSGLTGPYQGGGFQGATVSGGNGVAAGFNPF